MLWRGGQQILPTGLRGRRLKNVGWAALCLPGGIHSVNIKLVCRRQAGGQRSRAGAQQGSAACQCICSVGVNIAPSKELLLPGPNSRPHTQAGRHTCMPCHAMPCRAGHAGHIEATCTTAAGLRAALTADWREGKVVLPLLAWGPWDQHKALLQRKARRVVRVEVWDWVGWGAVGWVQAWVLAGAGQAFHSSPCRQAHPWSHLLPHPGCHRKTPPSSGSQIRLQAGQE